MEAEHKSDRSTASPIHRDAPTIAVNAGTRSGAQERGGRRRLGGWPFVARLDAKASVSGSFNVRHAIPRYEQRLHEQKSDAWP